MKDAALKVIAAIITAAIVSTAGALWKMNERLTRIETKLETLAPQRVASNGVKL